jgi:phosphatidylserine decarboxylase
VSTFARGAWRYGVPVGAVGLAVAVVSVPLAAALWAVAGGVFWFHRDPDRSVPAEGVVAPADGTVSVLREEGGRLRLGIFMNLHHVHVNRAPYGGTVEAVDHSPGGHWPAFSKRSDRNEKLRIDFGDHEVVLIAGAVARRIHPYVTEGATVERGERIGNISFSSRVDLLFPPEVDRADLLVAEGDSVRAGETRLLAGVPVGSTALETYTG